MAEFLSGCIKDPLSNLVGSDSTYMLTLVCSWAALVGGKVSLTLQYLWQFLLCFTNKYIGHCDWQIIAETEETGGCSSSKAPPAMTG